MKGLFMKDLLVLRKYARTMAVFILVYIVVFSMLDSVDVISGMVTLVLAMMSVATFSYDELAKWDRFGLTMPVSRKQAVASRYLVCLLFTVLGGVITLAFSLVFGYIRKTGDPAQSLLSSYTILSVAVLFLSLILPFLYKFGPERGRLFMILVFLLPSMLLLFFKDSISGFFPSEATLEQAFLFSLPVALAVLLLSFWISCRIYGKKEF